MGKKKLLKLLRTLTKEETRQFARWIDADVISQSTALQELYGYVRKFYPTYPSDDLSLENIASAVFTKEAYNPKKIRDLLSDLSLLLEDYLAWVEVRADNLLRRKVLARSMARRNDLENFDQQIYQAKQLLQRNKRRGLWHYRELNYLNDLYFTEPVASSRTLTSVKEVLSKYEITQIYITLNYVQLELGRLANLTLNRKTDQPTYLDSAHVALIEKLSADLPVFEMISYLLYALKQDVTISTYKELKTKFINLREEFDFENDLDFFKVIRNYVTHLQRLYSKEGAILNEVIDFEHYGLESGIYSVGKRISDGTFINLVVLFSYHRGFVFTEEFIKKYSQKLRLSTRTTIINVARAYNHFRIKDFDAVLRLLHEVQLEDPVIKLRYRTILLRTYLEQILANNTDLLPLATSFSVAFIRFVRRDDKFQGNLRQSYINMISFIKFLLTQIDTPPWKRKSIESLRSKLLSYENIALKGWLHQKIDQYEVFYMN